MRIAFVPEPPLFLPALTGRSAPSEIGPVRTAARSAVAWLADGADSLSVIGSAPTRSTWPSGSTGSTHDLGVESAYRLGRAPLPTGRDVEPRPDPAMPTSMLVAAALLAPYDVEVRGYAVRDGLSPDQQADLARTRRPLLVVGDGSARRRDGAPGYLDARAVRYDDAVAEILAHGDAGALGRLDADLGRELLVGGGPAWRALSDLVGVASVERASLDLYAAPFGVGYFVARWWGGAEHGWS